MMAINMGERFGLEERTIDGTRAYIYDCPKHGRIAFNADTVDEHHIIAHPCCFKEKLEAMGIE